MSSTKASATLTAPDISCAHCIASVKQAVGALEGVERVEASEQTKQIVVDFDAERTSETQIRAALDDAGYPAKP